MTTLPLVGATSAHSHPSLSFLGAIEIMSNDNRPTKKRVKEGVKLKLALWMIQNKARLDGQTIPFIRDLIHKEHGFHLPDSALRTLCETAGIQQRRYAGNAGNFTSKTKTLAIIVRDLMVHLGADVPPTLNDLCE